MRFWCAKIWSKSPQKKQAKGRGPEIKPAKRLEDRHASATSPSKLFRDGETTIKHKICTFEGALGEREEDLSNKLAFFFLCIFPFFSWEALRQ